VGGRQLPDQLDVGQFGVVRLREAARCIRPLLDRGALRAHLNTVPHAGTINNRPQTGPKSEKFPVARRQAVSLYFSDGLVGQRTDRPWSLLEPFQALFFRFV
jgi:hypothetical protein